MVAGVQFSEMPGSDTNRFCTFSAPVHLPILYWLTHLYAGRKEIPALKNFLDWINVNKIEIKKSQRYGEDNHAQHR